jgi:hypothetical protein
MRANGQNFVQINTQVKNKKNKSKTEEYAEDQEPAKQNKGQEKNKKK